MPSQEDFERHLRRIARRQAVRLSFEIRPDCWHHLELFIHAGAERMKTERALRNRPRLALAEANLNAFVAQMVIEARAGNVTTLHEFTFHQARSFLCPLWPFC